MYKDKLIRSALSQCITNSGRTKYLSLVSTLFILIFILITLTVFMYSPASYSQSSLSLQPLNAAIPGTVYPGSNSYYQLRTGVLNNFSLPGKVISSQYYSPPVNLFSSFPNAGPSASGYLNLFSSLGGLYSPSLNTNNPLNFLLSNRVSSSNLYYPLRSSAFAAANSGNALFTSPLGRFYAGINSNLLNWYRIEQVVPVDAIPTYTYLVVNAYLHDRTAFTQGLVFENGFLYEGTGIPGSSSLRKVELETGAVLQILELAPQYFGEGITIFGNRIIQLTWLHNIGFVYDKNTFTLLQEFSYPTEGWGITHDGKNLIMSDGTSTLHFLDPVTFAEVNQIQVYDADGPVVRLNELEYIQGEIFANIWLTDRIARISPLTGQVTGWIDLTGLLNTADLIYPVDVLNGIAYDPINDRLFVTGKFWPTLFEIKLIPL